MFHRRAAARRDRREPAAMAVRRHALPLSIEQIAVIADVSLSIPP